MKQTDDIDFGSLTTYGGDADESFGGGIRSMKVYRGDGFFTTIRLSDIFGSRVEEVEDAATGGVQRGLFIPFEGSGVTVTSKNNVLATYRMEASEVPTPHHTHLLRQVMGGDIAEHWRALGYKQGFNGFAKPIYGGMPKKKRTIKL